MAQRAIAVFLAVGLHSGDAAVPAVAYEVQSWYNPQDCSGPPDDVRRYPLEICREEKWYDDSFRYYFDRQINDTHLGMTSPVWSGSGGPFQQCCHGLDWCDPEYFKLMGSASCTRVSQSAVGSFGYFWVYSKDLAV